MDGDSNPTTENGEVGGPPEACGKGRPPGAALVRCAFTVVFSLTASFLVGLVAIAVGLLSSTGAALVPSECKILSSGVDLRSSRHCGLTLSGYKDQNVLYRLEKARVLCRDDYYWVSFFQVEYKDFFSGRNVNAIAETPREALPSDCRPNFNAVWLIKSMFKVNETYKCRYAPGIHRADIFSDEIFNCQASETFDLQKAKRSLSLLVKPMSSIFADKDKRGDPMLSMLVGIITGMVVSICLSVMMRAVYILKLSLPSSSVSREHLGHFAMRLRRGCLVVAYISAMGWLTVQYSKVIGLKKMLLSSDLRERIFQRDDL